MAKKKNSCCQGLIRTETEVGDSGIPEFWDSQLCFTLLTLLTQNRRLFFMCCAIWCHLYNFKKREKTHGGMLLLAHFAKSNNPPWVFFTFLELCKWCQIVQSIPFVAFVQWLVLWQFLNCHVRKNNKESWYNRFRYPLFLKLKLQNWQFGTQNRVKYSSKAKLFYF